MESRLYINDFTSNEKIKLRNLLERYNKVSKTSVDAFIQTLITDIFMIPLPISMTAPPFNANSQVDDNFINNVK